MGSPVHSPRPDSLISLYAYIAGRSILEPTGCLRWTGAMSQSGWRGVFYPVMRFHGYWRINRLLCCLQEASLLECTASTLPATLWALNTHHAGDEASHTCDLAACVNGDHLAWQSHRQNVIDQAARRQASV